MEAQHIARFQSSPKIAFEGFIIPLNLAETDCPGHLRRAPGRINREPFPPRDNFLQAGGRGINCHNLRRDIFCCFAPGLGGQVNGRTNRRILRIRQPAQAQICGQI